MLPSTVRSHFFSILSETERNINAYVIKPGKDMTRHRYCDFTDTVLATMSFSMNRSNTELLNYFTITNPHIPSKSAFTQQRKKFNSDLFPHLLKAFNQAIPFKKEFHGYHLVAVDGSDLNLPTDRKDQVYCVKQARSDRYYYQMHLNALFDICENRYVSVSTQARKDMNENAAFCELVKGCSMPENTIFIADRGYCTLNTLAHLLKNNRYFLIRAKSPAAASSFTKNLMKPDIESDQMLSIGVGRSRKVLRKYHFDKYFLWRRKRTFDYINPEDKASVYPMSLRFTCIKLGDNSYEYLVSNLPPDVFSAADLKALYWKRWSIETSFRRLKYALSLVYLHSANRELIKQEVYAKIIMYNFASLIHAFAQQSKEVQDIIKQKQNKYNYKVSFDDAVPITTDYLKSPIKNKIIKALLLRHLTAVKKHEMSARHMHSQTVKPLNNRA